MNKHKVRAAIRDLQHEIGVDTDGIVGPVTVDALYRSGFLFDGPRTRDAIAAMMAQSPAAFVSRGFIIGEHAIVKLERTADGKVWYEINHDLYVFESGYCSTFADALERCAAALLELARSQPEQT